MSLAWKLGKSCLVIAFILSGSADLLHWNQREERVLHALAHWQECLTSIPELQRWVIEAATYSSTFLGALLFLELFGAILVGLGIATRLGAFLLLVFLISTTLLYHDFWMLQGVERSQEQVLFLKNLSIIGGVLLILGKNKRLTSFSPL